MIWQEIYFSRILKKDELKKTVSKIFSVHINSVQVVSDLSVLDNCKVDYKILCITYLLPNNKEFKLRVDISCIDNLRPKNDIEFFAEIIELLHCKILIDNYSVIPNTMLMIESITINNDNFDEVQDYDLE